ncbi:MAG: transglutaminase [Ramlibacter sp.]|jgi:transglutaminase-like putative cysteine protease|nr:transglutaminase [Ramlibacter sp.]MCE3272448.1 transglutaminase [Ramlibacter sp.]
MLLHVLHETSYRYVPAVRTAQHMVHLKPAHNARQQLLNHRLAIDPEPARHNETVDVYGNTRTFFSLQFSHEALRVTAESLVSTTAVPEPATSLPWDDVVERIRYHRRTHYDPASEFAFASPYVPRDKAFADYALPSFPAGRPLAEAARELMHRIYEDFEYETTATDVNTPALEALALRKGVCQDLAHVMLGCLRSLGLPARYVSGYLLTHPPEGKPRLVGSDASHAWAAVYLPAPGKPGEWLDLDPTNDRPAGEDYVTLAIGRDYSDVSPMRGVIHGGANHRLRVAVTVTPAENDGMTAAAPAMTE